MYLFRRQQNDQAKTILDKSFTSLPAADRKKFKLKYFILKIFVCFFF